MDFIKLDTHPHPQYCSIDRQKKKRTSSFFFVVSVADKHSDKYKCNFLSALVQNNEYLGWYFCAICIEN